MYKAARYAARYHRQDSNKDCGQACAQITIGSFGRFYVRQNELINELTTDCSPPGESLDDGWGANPCCLAAQLNIERGRAAPDPSRNFRLISCRSAVTVSHWIVYSLFSGGAAPNAVVWGGGHWVVVYACEVKRRPPSGLWEICVDMFARLAGSDALVRVKDPFDRRYTIQAFYARDPAPGRPWQENQEAHAQNDTDDHCGTGVDADGVNWGLTSRRVRYAFWRQRWMRPIPVDPYDTRYWVGKCLAVVDAKLPYHQDSCDQCKSSTCASNACDANDAPDSPALAPRQGPYCPPRKPADVFSAAMNALQADGLRSPSAPEPWGALLQHAQAERFTCVQPPHKYADDPGGLGFYLVEMVLRDGSANDGNVVGLVLLDSSSLEMLEAAVVRGPSNTAIVFNDVTEYVKALTRDGQLVRLPGLLNPVQIMPSDFQLPPNVVWRHGPQSLSPYAPFYEFRLRLPPRPGVPVLFETVVYVRVDDPTIIKTLPPPPQPPGAPFDLAPFTKIF